MHHAEPLRLSTLSNDVVNLMTVSVIFSKITHVNLLHPVKRLQLSKARKRASDPAPLSLSRERKVLLKITYISK